MILVILMYAYILSDVSLSVLHLRFFYSGKREERRGVDAYRSALPLGPSLVGRRQEPH